MSGRERASQLYSQHVVNWDLNSGLLTRQLTCSTFHKRRTPTQPSEITKYTAAADVNSRWGAVCMMRRVVGKVKWVFSPILYLNAHLTLNFYSICQGLQIFILYTVKTKIFQSEASKVLKSLSQSTGRVKVLPSVTVLRLRVRMYNMLRSFPALSGHFRLLEPSVVVEETTLWERDQEDTSI